MYFGALSVFRVRISDSQPVGRDPFYEGRLRPLENTGAYIMIYDNNKIIVME